jgi:hypothetical protein
MRPQAVGDLLRKTLVLEEVLGSHALAPPKT